MRMYSVIFVVGMMGCASSAPAVGSCGINSPEWPAARSDYDRATTLAVLGSLKHVVEQERASVHSGQRQSLGQRADDLFRAPASSSSGYVAQGALELALRLRQLDCAVIRGQLHSPEAEARYDSILVELDAERLALGWTPGAAMTAGATSTGAQLQ
jgi:hypothetical protein